MTKPVQTPTPPTLEPPGQTTTSEPRRRRASYLRQDGVAHLFLSPWLAGLVLITAGPLVASLLLSFTDYNLLSAPGWIGLDNYARMLGDASFWASARVTLSYVVVSVPLQLAVALALALVLDKGLRGLGIYRSAYYLPSLLGGSVAVALLWRQIFGQDGLINQLLALIGIEGSSWLNNPDTALFTLIVLNAWTFGSPMIVFLAGLRQVPTALYESAKVDGAGRWSTFVHITMPMLSPIVFFNLILQTINAFQAFTPAYVISGGTGGPNESTLFYTLYLYQRGFRGLEMGYASALAWVLLAVIAILTAANFLFSRFWVFYSDDN